jgi:hypothetical protein
MNNSRFPHNNHASDSLPRTVLVLTALMCTFVFLPTALAVTFSCSFKTSCLANETGLLRAQNDSGEWNNAHAQLMSYGTLYNYTLCCGTDATHTLDNSCANPNATIVLRLNASTNSHVQIPGVNTYGLSACMALSPGNLSCTYPNSTCSGSSGILSLASSDSSNTTNAHVGNYSFYRLNVCCVGGNSPPTVPVLTYPVAGNSSVFERTIAFDWQDSTDPDGDPITYNFSLTNAVCPTINQSGLSPSTYTSSELCVDYLYNWTVQACDPTACSAWASVRNFTIPNTPGLVFVVNNTDFGAVARNTSKNTTTSAPPPFLVENTGNVPLNVTFKANSQLYITSGLGNSSFQYKARENETSAYTGAQTSWTNISASTTALFTSLGYNASADAAYVDILIAPPYNEPAGAKSTTLTVQGSYG